ncbi:MAG: OstA-like protein, partial [Bacteroidota bacterium]
MKQNKFILGIFLCCLLGSLQLLHAQVSPQDAPKTTTTVAGDSLKEVQILHAVKLNFLRPNDTTDLQILVGDVKLKQGNTLFMCDSCVINNNHHLFEAFGKVHILDSDTTNIYSDYLKYLTDKKISYFNGNVKLTDGHGELTTPDMEYDMNTKIGTYVHGGTVKNKKSVLTSNEGYYYADLKDVYFKKNVVLKDPAYSLKADSLLYSTAFETVRFITETVIVDSSKRTITTSEGFYDLKQGKAEFGKRPVVQDGKTTIIADHIRFDDSTGISQAKGRAIIRDTTQGTTIIADEIFRNRKTEAILATKKPLMIIKQDNDSLYVTADTLFSARLTDLHSSPASFKTDSTAKTDSSVKENMILNIDSLSRKGLAAIEYTRVDSVLALNEKIVPVTDSLWEKRLMAKRDSVFRSDTAVQKNIVVNKEGAEKKEASLQKRNLFNKNVIAVNDSLSHSDSVSNSVAGKLTTDSAVIKKDTLRGVTVVPLDEKDSTNRYFEAYRHVRIFSDSLQAVSDSMFYSFHDSTFRLFYDPILWAQGSQVTGDTIILLTKNKKADRMKVINNSFLVNKLDKEAFNQVKSSRMDAYFLDGGIDSVRAKGFAECIYYLQDKDSAYTGINQSTSDFLDAYFRNKELHRVVFRSQVKGTVWPIRQKNPSEMR